MVQIMNFKSQKMSNRCCKLFLKYSRMLIGVDSTVHSLPTPPSPLPSKDRVKSSFCSQDVLIFVVIFWPCRKTGLIRKIKLISKVRTLQSGLQTIAIHVLPNVSRSKVNQIMKFDQVIEYNKRNAFLKKSCGK